MNRQYMDFAPRRQIRTKRVATMPAVGKAPTGGQLAARPARKVVSTKEQRLGVIEDLGPSGEVEMRAKIVEERNEIKEVKSKKVGLRAAGKVENAPMGLKAEKRDDSFRTPKPKFINQDKIEKRPLSKNVYRKEVKAPKEEPKGPVTIITKPEKSRISLVVTIILTIIMGAVAGTVAFLLLPK